MQRFDLILNALCNYQHIQHKKRIFQSPVWSENCIEVDIERSRDREILSRCFLCLVSTLLNGILLNMLKENGSTIDESKCFQAKIMLLRKVRVSYVWNKNWFVLFLLVVVSWNFFAYLFCFACIYSVIQYYCGEGNCYSCHNA